MLNQFFERFGDIENNAILAESTILDPRFKKFGFKEESKYTTAVGNLRRKISAIYNKNKTILQEISEADYNVPSSSAIKKPTLWSHFDQDVGNLLQEKNSTAAAIVELDRYLSEPLISRNEDPLAWWVTRKHVYPTLFNYVKKRLCIQATSVPCERIFSKAGLTLTQKRSALKSLRVSKILFLNSNL
uniref:Zinc finger BED domain-containing protein 1-like n=1 Tax=Diabrotica virgifera virgifera TaxID=50390 RepID=A0A6P7H014_DIAVI